MSKQDQANLKKLHEFAEKERPGVEAARQAAAAEKARQAAEQAELKAQMLQELQKLTATFVEAYHTLPDDQDVVFPLGNNLNLVIRKTFSQIGMAITTNAEKSLEGYEPSFDDIQDWQIVTVDYYPDTKQTKPRQLFHWDRARLDQYAKDQSIFLGLADQTSLERLEKMEFDELTNAVEVASRSIPLPTFPTSEQKNP